MGADGVQIYAVEGEMAPENMDQNSRKHLKSYLESIGLEISALCGDLGGMGSRMLIKTLLKSKNPNAFWISLQNWEQIL